MSIFVSGSPLNSIDALSPASRTILQMINCGESWLKNAINDASTKGRFDTESALLKAILLGLYNAELLTVDSINLTVGIDKLLSIDPNDLRDLYSCSVRMNEPPKKSNNLNIDKLQVDSLLLKYDLLDNLNLESAKLKAEQKGLSSNHFLSSLGLNQSIRLCLLVTNSTQIQQKKTLIRLASSQADSVAQNSSGFISLFKTQLDFLINQPIEDNKLPLVSTLFDELIPALDGYLECPHSGIPPDQSTLDKIIGAWLSSKKQIGFKDAYSALGQLTEHYKNEIPITKVEAPMQSDSEQSASKQSRTDRWKELAQEYIIGAQNCISAASAVDAEILQDGKTWRYQFDNKMGKATLLYSARGNLSLDSFVPISHK